MKRKIIGILVATLILFVWNAIAWMALPFHSNSLNNLPESSINEASLQSDLPKDGVYHYPGMPEDNSMEAMESLQEKLKDGPRITLMVVKKGSTEIFDPKTFAFSFLLNLFTAIISLLLLSFVADKSLKRILTASILIGLLVAFVSDIPQMNWFMFPLDYTLAYVIDHLVAFGLLGLWYGAYVFKVSAKN